MATRELSIWAYALGYFACYAPYSALTKVVSKSTGGFSLLPITTLASLAGMVVFLTAAGWWRHAGQRTVLGRRVPVPGLWTGLSGIATAAIIATTTLAYTFEGVSIVFMMLLMRGGVLVLAPIVDALTGRRVRVTSWIALGLSMAALVLATSSGSSGALTIIAGVDVALYLAGYFVRLRFMSRLAKTDDRSASVRYFVEEQMVATPAVVAFLVAVALVGEGPIMLAVREGFTSMWTSDALVPAIVIGLFSQGTGIFGALVLLDGRENAFCVPVNRASSVLAGVVASAILAAIGLGAGVPHAELAGAVLVLGAIVALAAPSLRTRKVGVPCPVTQASSASRT